MTVKKWRVLHQTLPAPYDEQVPIVSTSQMKAYASGNTKKTQKMLIGFFLRHLLDSGKSAVGKRSNKLGVQRRSYGVQSASRNTSYFGVQNKPRGSWRVYRSPSLDLSMCARTLVLETRMSM